MPTRLFYPFKLTSWNVIIGCLVLVTVVIFILFTEIVVSFKQPVLTLIRHYFIQNQPCVYVGSVLFVKFLYMGARQYGTKWLCSNNIKMSSLSVWMVYIPVNNISVILGHFMTFCVTPVLSRKDTKQCPRWVSNKWPLRYCFWLYLTTWKSGHCGTRIKK